MTELARAGLSVEDSLAGAEGVLQLATAAQIDFADAAKISANALNSFGLEGDQAVRVADVFANAANEAQGSIEDIGIAFRQASAVARQVGLSLEDTTALLTQFSRAGLTGSDAGTSLRTALIKLTAPTDRAKEVIKELNFEIRDAAGNIRPDVFIEFGRVTRNLEPAARDAAAAIIFGTDAIRAAAIGSRATAGELRLLQAQMADTGTASDVAAARTKGLGGSIQALKSTLETAGTAFGQLASGPIQAYIDAAGDAAAVTGGLIKELANVGSAVGGIDTPIGKLGDRITDVLFAFSGITQARLAARGLREFGVGVDETAQKIKGLQKEIDLLESARIGTAVFAPSVANGIKKQIEGIQQKIADLKKEAQGIATGVAGPMVEALEDLKEFQEGLGGPGIDLGLDKMIADLEKLIPITVQTEGNITRLRDDVLGLGDDADKTSPKIRTLAQVLARTESTGVGYLGGTAPLADGGRDAAAADQRADGGHRHPARHHCEGAGTRRQRCGDGDQRGQREDQGGPGRDRIPSVGDHLGCRGGGGQGRRRSRQAGHRRSAPAGCCHPTIGTRPRPCCSHRRAAG